MAEEDPLRKFWLVLPFHRERAYDPSGPIVKLYPLEFALLKRKRMPPPSPLRIIICTWKAKLAKLVA